jgi:Uma2 family endonuclease
MPRAVRFSYEDLQLYGDDKRRELLGGEIFVTPAPNIKHQRVVARLFLLLGNHLVNNPLGEAFVAPIDVILSDEDVVEPDVLYVSRERAHIVKEQRLEGAPDWVIEVTSPSTRKRDFTLKQKLYFHHGVRLYWVIDPEAEMLHAWEAGVHRVHAVGETAAVSLLPGFSVSVAELLA